MINIDPNTNIQELVSKYPNITDIMIKLGFSDIIKSGMLQTVGRFMTIEKGAKIKKIEWNTIVKTFEENGFQFKKEEGNERIY